MVPLKSVDGLLENPLYINNIVINYKRYRNLMIIVSFYHSLNMPSKRKLEDESEDKISCHSKLVGVDEAGRGPALGPIYVAAVILRSDFKAGEGVVIRDSKTMSKMQLRKAAKYIKKYAKEYQIGSRLYNTITFLTTIEMKR
jgi:ribonuclease HIII